MLETKDSETQKARRCSHTNGETALPSTDCKTSENAEDPESDSAGYAIWSVSAELNRLNKMLFTCAHGIHVVSMATGSMLSSLHTLSCLIFTTFFQSRFIIPT